MHNKTDLISQRFEIASDVLFREVDDEGILLQLDKGTYYSLNETSVPFWQALQQQRPLSEVVDSIAREYDIDKSQVINDLQKFLLDLSALELIAATVS